ncbi:sensor histidine kinase [Streptomyces fradiae]|uniref:sensor histidine kinase n=1 Tax=Streptomyces fradiae TaxID=1906 RepID=UPI0036AA1594
MSPLRAPAARPDRREGGGRHGRTGTRPQPQHGRPQPAPPPPDARIRPRLRRVAVLPAAVTALGGTGAMLFTLYSTGARPTPALWTVLTCAAALAVAAVTAAALGADRAARSVGDRCNALRRSTARGQSELRDLVEQLRRGERLPARQAPPAAPAGDDLDLLAHELGRAQDAAVATVVQAFRRSSSVGDAQKVEVFVNLARRLQSLVHREIQLLDELENAVEDPELLKGLFHIDHLATRIRRHAENLAVLGGAIARRQWSNPVSMTEVLRSSIAEVEQYPRVKLVPPIDGTLRGHAVADVIHLLAELVENATLYSAPHTSVLLRTQYVTAGLAVEVEDRGLGMAVAEQEKMNALLCDPDQVNVARLLQDGRIGLYVVSALARRHGIAVRLQSNIYGGVQAVLVIPQGLLGTDPANPHQSGRPAATEAAGARPGPEAGPVPEGPAPAPHQTPAPHQAPAAIPARHEAPAAYEPAAPHEPTAPHGPAAPYEPTAPHQAPDPVKAPLTAGPGGRPAGGPRHAAPRPAPEPLPVRGGRTGHADRAGHPEPPHPAPEPRSAAPDRPASADRAPQTEADHRDRTRPEPTRNTPEQAGPGGLPGPRQPDGPHHGPAAVHPPHHPSGPPPRHTATDHPPLPGAHLQADQGARPQAAPGAPPPAEPSAPGPGTYAPGPHTPADSAAHDPAAHDPGTPGPGIPTPGTPDPGTYDPGARPAGPSGEDPGAGGGARPRLPKRRAQEHLVPQLRGEPVRRRHDDDTLHDPGLMAAFQRGIGLAESMPEPPPPPAALADPPPAPAALADPPPPPAALADPPPRQPPTTPQPFPAVLPHSSPAAGRDQLRTPASIPAAPRRHHDEAHKE